MIRETLYKIPVGRIPEGESEFKELMTEMIASPQGTAALFVIALIVTAADRETGFRCIEDVCATDIDERVLEAVVPGKEELGKIAASYVQEIIDPDGTGTNAVTVKLTDEKALKKNMKTVYVGCSGTASYRPLTLISRPPKYLKKRFGIKKEYYEDPWFVADFPSMVLPVIYH